MLNHLCWYFEKLINIVFIGGLTNGKKILDFIFRKENKSKILVSLIITYPPNKNLPRKVSLKKYSNFTTIINEYNSDNLTKIIKEKKPDYILCCGWNRILSKKILKIPPYGVVGFHPSKLPKFRGRSVVAWQIEKGLKKSGVTMFYYDQTVDTGDIIDFCEFKIEENDYISDILNKIDNAVIQLFKTNFELFLDKNLKGYKQNNIKSSYMPLRNIDNQMINWNNKSQNIYNKIRAISKPYPRAIGIIDNQRFYIEKASIVTTPNRLINKKPGNYCRLNKKKNIIIRCKDNSLKISFNDMKKYKKI